MMMKAVQETKGEAVQENTTQLVKPYQTCTLVAMLGTQMMGHADAAQQGCNIICNMLTSLLSLAHQNCMTLPQYQYLYVLQMGNLVSERDLKLRLALKNMGMLDSSYWVSWMMFDAVITFVTALLLVIFGKRSWKLQTWSCCKSTAWCTSSMCAYHRPNLR